MKNHLNQFSPIPSSYTPFTAPTDVIKCYKCKSLCLSVRPICLLRSHGYTADDFDELGKEIQLFPYLIHQLDQSPKVFPKCNSLTLSDSVSVSHGEDYSRTKLFC